MIEFALRCLCSKQLNAIASPIAVATDPGRQLRIATYLDGRQVPIIRLYDLINQKINEFSSINKV